MANAHVANLIERLLADRVDGFYSAPKLKAVLVAERHEAAIELTALVQEVAKLRKALELYTEDAVCGLREREVSSGIAAREALSHD